MQSASREVEDSFVHGGASYHFWLHLPHDIKGERINGVVAARVTRITPDHPTELVDRQGSPHLFLQAHSFEEAGDILREAIRAGELADGLPHAVIPDSPGDGA